ncbi:MAG: hypothetical protein KBA47_00300 [Caldisericia bacterium]|nr:hypothetical protein [Caldisericia bacterium]
MLKIKKINLKLLAEDNIYFSPFPENFIRGILGKYLYDLEKNIFSPNQNSIDDLSFLKNRNPPRPYFFNLKLKEKYSKGDIFFIEIILIGKYINFKDIFINTIEKMGKDGIGKLKRKYKIEDIEDSEIVLNHNKNIEKIEPKEKNIKIEFETPVAITKNGKITENFQFSEIIKRFFERYTNMLYNWCDVKEIIDYREYIKLAENIEIKNRNLKKVTYYRESGTNKQNYKLFGYIGSFECVGKISDIFFDIFKIMEELRIGNDIAWGFGKISVEKKSS